MPLTAEDREFLMEWIVEPITKKIDTLHTPPCKQLETLQNETEYAKKDIKRIDRQIYIWVGGLTVLIFILGVIMAFVK